MGYELTENTEPGTSRFALRSSTRVEQWADSCAQKGSDASMVAAQRTVDQHFGSLQVFEARARQALEPPPQLCGKIFSGEFDSQVKLNVQITNVPEVSSPVDPREWLHHIDGVFAAGAKAVKPVEQSFAKANAVNDALISIGPALDDTVNYYANTPLHELLRDVRNVTTVAAEVLDSTVARPLTAVERANITGAAMPMFFLDGDMKPLHSETAQQLGLHEMNESELSKLGILRITRKAGKGGDWPVINERPSPDVVRQSGPVGCVAAAGEMLSEGRLNQIELFDKVRTIPELLAEKLGSEWVCKFVTDKQSSFRELIRRGKSWTAEMHDESYHRHKMGHMVVIDGLDESGYVMVRDPQDATRYEMTVQDFVKHWTGRGVWR